METEDESRVGVYQISYRAYYMDYPENYIDSINAFTVTISDSCSEPISVTASS